MRWFLDDFISPFQSSFVPDRRIADNVVLLWEAVNVLERKKGRTGAFMVNLDLEKAYDRTEWDFIKKVLEFFHFPSQFVKIVMHCISSAKISELLNGERLSQFLPSRGIRQVDAISPYIFILCMEYLSIMIENKINDGTWTRVGTGRGVLKLSHLFFVDDVILFSTADKASCEALRLTLESFHSFSG